MPSTCAGHRKLAPPIPHFPAARVANRSSVPRAASARPQRYKDRITPVHGFLLSFDCLGGRWWVAQESLCSGFMKPTLVFALLFLMVSHALAGPMRDQSRKDRRWRRAMDHAGNMVVAAQEYDWSKKWVASSSEKAVLRSTLAARTVPTGKKKVETALDVARQVHAFFGSEEAVRIADGMVASVRGKGQSPTLDAALLHQRLTNQLVKTEGPLAPRFPRAPQPARSPSTVRVVINTLVDVLRGGRRN
jgi:hypothetical protein